MPLPQFPDRRGTLAVRVCRFPGSPRRETDRTAAKPLSGMGKSERFRRRKRNIPCSQGIFRCRGARYRAAGGGLPVRRPDAASRRHASGRRERHGSCCCLQHPHLPSGTATIRYFDDDYVHIANNHSAAAADASLGRALCLANNGFCEKAQDKPAALDTNPRPHRHSGAGREGGFLPVAASTSSTPELHLSENAWRSADRVRQCHILRKSEWLRQETPRKPRLYAVMDT